MREGKKVKAIGKNSELIAKLLIVFLIISTGFILTKATVVPTYCDDLEYSIDNLSNKTSSALKGVTTALGGVAAALFGVFSIINVMRLISGDEKKIQQAKTGLIWAIVGLILAVLIIAQVPQTLILNFVNENFGTSVSF